MRKNSQDVEQGLPTEELTLSLSLFAKCMESLDEPVASAERPSVPAGYDALLEGGCDLLQSLKSMLGPGEAPDEVT